MSDLDAIIEIHSTQAPPSPTEPPPPPTGHTIASTGRLDRFARLRRLGATISIIPEINGTPWASWRAADGRQCHVNLDALGDHNTLDDAGRCSLNDVAGWVTRRETPPEHEISGWREIAREINRERKEQGERKGGNE